MQDTHLTRTDSECSGRGARGGVGGEQAKARALVGVRGVVTREQKDGRTALSTFSSSMCAGSGSCTRIPFTSGSALYVRTTCCERR